MANNIVTASFPTFQRMIASFAHAMPAKVDRRAFPRTSGTTASEMVGACVTLGLCDEGGKPTARLADLVGAWSTEDYPKQLASLLRGEFDLVRENDFGSITSADLEQAIVARHPSLGRPDVRRMATFLIGAAAAGGLRSPQSGEDERPTTSSAVPTDAGHGDPAWSATKAVHVLLEEVYDPGVMPEGSEGERAVMTLIRVIKRSGRRDP